MKVSILYSSKTGNTRKLAYSIANELSDFEITITDIKTMESLPQADAYLIGYWVDKAQPNEEAKHCIEQITGKPVGLFGTLGAYAYSSHGSQSMQNANAMLGEGCTLIGSFLCQGPVDPKLLERFKSLQPDNPHALTTEKKLMQNMPHSYLENDWNNYHKKELCYHVAELFFVYINKAEVALIIIE